VGGHALLVCLVSIAVLGRCVAASAQVVPPDLQATILVRMLGYDRSLKPRAGNVVGLGIVYKASDKASTQTYNDMLRAFKSIESQTVQGMPIKISSLAYKDATGLAEWMIKDGVVALYIAPGLGPELDAIRSVCQQKKIVSMSPVRVFVEQGVAVGVVVKGDSPRLLVNLTAAESLGMDLDSKLLQLADIVR
jgi:hypothetical protein